MKLKTILLLSLGLTIILNEISCKSIAKAAAKHWTKKQVKAFKSDCHGKVSKKFGDQKAKQFCDCAVSTLSEKYTKVEDALNLGNLQLLKEASACVKNN